MANVLFALGCLAARRNLSSHSLFAAAEIKLDCVVLSGMAQPNNGMHPTASQRAPHRELGRSCGSSRRVMPGVRPQVSAYVWRRKEYVT